MNIGETVRPEVYGALTLAEYHANVATWGAWGRHGWGRVGSNHASRRLRHKHESKAQKLRARAERLAGRQIGGAA